jgi:hypothetical protein
MCKTEVKTDRSNRDKGESSTEIRENAQLQSASSNRD